MYSLDEVNDIISKIDIGREWERATQFKAVVLSSDHDDTFDYQSSGNDKSQARLKRGVYRHTTFINDQMHVLYVGKAEGQTSSIAARNSRHLHAFTHPDFTGEMSGKKYRQYMEDNELEELIIVIDYIDMTHHDPSMIPMFERKSIDHFKAVLNQ